MFRLESPRNSLAQTIMVDSEPISILRSCFASGLLMTADIINTPDQWNSNSCRIHDCKIWWRVISAPWMKRVIDWYLSKDKSPSWYLRSLLSKLLNGPESSRRLAGTKSSLRHQNLLHQEPSISEIFLGYIDIQHRGFYPIGIVIGRSFYHQNLTLGRHFLWKPHSWQARIA